jgi:hypothetical protein
MTSFIESTKESSKGGFKGIKKVRGTLVDIKLVAPPEKWDSTKQQVQVFMEDTAVLEMFPGEDMFELKEGKFNFYIAYAEEGKKPTSNSSYIKVWVASAERLGKKPSDFIGKVVTLDKVRTKLFDTKNKETKEKEEVWTESCFGFSEDETSTSAGVKDYIKALVLGKNQKAALRELIIDPRAKQLPEFKEALGAGTLADMLGLVYVDDKFAEKEG